MCLEISPRKHFPFIYLFALCVATLIPWPTFWKKPQLLASNPAAHEELYSGYWCLLCEIRVQRFLPRPLWGQNSLIWARDLLMCPWSHVLWATCFVPRASLVISRLEYTLFKTQQFEKSIYDLKRWHKHHFFLGLHNDHQESSKPLKCMCHFSPLVTISRSLFAHF